MKINNEIRMMNAEHDRPANHANGCEKKFQQKKIHSRYSWPSCSSLLFVSIGVHSWLRFRIVAPRRGAVKNVVNYSAVAEEVKNFVRDQSVNLIETLADRLAIHLLKHFRIQKVTIELRKFPFEDAKYVSVTVTRTAFVE